MPSYGFGGGGGRATQVVTGSPFTSKAALDTWSQANPTQLINTNELVSVAVVAGAVIPSDNGTYQWSGTNLVYEPNAWVDYTGLDAADIKRLYESNPNTNAFTDNDDTTVTGIQGLPDNTIPMGAGVGVAQSGLAVNPTTNYIESNKPLSVPDAGAITMGNFDFSNAGASVIATELATGRKFYPVAYELLSSGSSKAWRENFGPEVVTPAAASAIETFTSSGTNNSIEFAIVNVGRGSATQYTWTIPPGAAACNDVNLVIQIISRNNNPPVFDYRASTGGPGFDFPANPGATPLDVPMPLPRPAFFQEGIVIYVTLSAPAGQTLQLMGQTLTLPVVGTQTIPRVAVLGRVSTLAEIPDTADTIGSVVAGSSNVTVNTANRVATVSVDDGPINLSLEQLTDVNATSPTSPDAALLSAINAATTNSLTTTKSNGKTEFVFLWPAPGGTIPANAQTVLSKLTVGTTVGFTVNQTGGSTARVDFAIGQVISSLSGPNWLIELETTLETNLAAALSVLANIPGSVSTAYTISNTSLTKYTQAFDGNINPGDILYRNTADTAWNTRQMNVRYPISGNGTTTPLKVGNSTRNIPGDVLTYIAGGDSDFLPLPTPTNINLWMYSNFLATPQTLAEIKAGLPNQTPFADFNIGTFTTTLSESSPGNYYVTIVLPNYFFASSLVVNGTPYAISVIGDIAYKGVDYRVYRTPTPSVPLTASPVNASISIASVNPSGIYYFQNASGSLTAAQVEANFSEAQKLFDWQTNNFTTFQLVGTDNVAKYVYIAIPSDEVVTTINSRLAGGANNYGSIGVQLMFYVVYNGTNYGVYRSTTGTFAVTGSTFDVQFMSMQASATASSNLYFYQDSVVETLDSLKARLGNAYVVNDWNVNGSSTSFAFNSTTGYSVYTNIAIPVDCTISSIQVGPTVGPLVVQTFVFLGTFVYQGQSYNAYRTTSTIAETAGINYTLRIIVNPCPSICAKQVTGGFSVRGQTLVYNTTTGNLEVSQPVIGGFPVATTTPTNQYLLRYSSFTNTWNPDFDRLGGYGNSGAVGSSGQVPVLDTVNNWWTWGSATGNAGAVMSRRKSVAQTVNGDTRISWDTADTNNMSGLNVNLSYDGTTNVGRFTNSTGQGMSLVISWFGVWSVTSQHATTAFATWLKASWSGTGAGQQRYGYTNSVGSPDVTVSNCSASIWLDDGEWFEIWAWSTSATQSFGNNSGGAGPGFGASITITRVNP